jgi:hypothetical protein
MDDGDDLGSGVTEPLPPLRLDADSDSMAPAHGARTSGSGFDYDRRYDPKPGDAAMDERAKQWDSRYDGLAIGSSIGGDDQ